MSADSLQVVSAAWDAPKHVRAFNTTRHGGVSEAPYDSLNLGLHVNDDESSVVKNRTLLLQLQALPSEPHWLNQVHGSAVLDLSIATNHVTANELKTNTKKINAETVNAEKLHSGKSNAEILNASKLNGSHKADAAFTNQRDEVLCVVTADCLPVVITNDAGTELAVAHAGWKGIINGVLEASLEKFSATEHFHIWFGPAIGPSKFEVGLEVKEAFLAKDPAHESAFIASSTNAKKAYADIYALAQRTIQRQLNSSPSAVSFSGGKRCTMSEREHFHSYRRDGAESGRMALVAWLGH